MGAEKDSNNRAGGAGQSIGWRRRVMSRDEMLVRQGIQQDEVEREPFLHELRDAVRSGTYAPDAGEVAEALIRERQIEWKKAKGEEAEFEAARNAAETASRAATPDGLPGSPG